MLVIHYILHALNEPRINLGEVEESLYCVAFLKSLGNGEDTEVCWVGKFLVEIVELDMVVTYKSVHPLTNHTETLLKHFLKRAADRHNLAHRLHGRTDLTAYASELGQIPTWNLTDEIVE